METSALVLVIDVDVEDLKLFVLLLELVKDLLVAFLRGLLPRLNLHEHEAVVLGGQDFLSRSLIS